MNEDKASHYHRLQRRAAVASGVLTAGLLIVMVETGASAGLRNLAMSVTGAPASSLRTVAVFALALAVLQEAVAFPLAFYRGFLLERRYELSTESFSAWLTDHLKAFALGLLVGIAGAVFVYFAINRWPTWWWLISAAAFMVAIGGIAKAAPVWLLPLFYRFTPLERESLRARLVALSARAGVPVLGVYEWSLGDKTRRANAALVGTGRTRRIILSDTLVAQYSDDEIEVIMAHELAHHVHRDILTSLVLEFGVLLASFTLAAGVLRMQSTRLGLASAADVAGLPALMLAGGAAMLLVTPFANALSRRHERRADRYALALTGLAPAFVSAMRRLGAQNLAEEHPSRVTQWLFHTHPPIEQRISAAQNAGLGNEKR